MLERTFAAIRGKVRSAPSTSRPRATESRPAEDFVRPSLNPRASSGFKSGAASGAPPGNLFREVYEAERLSVSGIRLPQRPESLRALADAAIRRLAKDAARRSLHIENKIAEDIVAPCDRERILKVFLHLVANAIAASAERGKVMVDARAADGGTVVSVRDEGKGVDPRSWPYLFREGWRDPTRKGEGLGLSVSRTIVQAHGGKIWCESSLGHGTTFRFTLPARQAASTPNGEGAKAAAP